MQFPEHNVTEIINAFALMLTRILVILVSFTIFLQSTPSRS